MGHRFQSHPAAEEFSAKKFAMNAELMGAEPYPQYRKERLSKKDKRKMTAQRKSGMSSQRKVRDVVDFINYQRSFKFPGSVSKWKSREDEKLEFESFCRAVAEAHNSRY